MVNPESPRAAVAPDLRKVRLLVDMMGLFWKKGLCVEKGICHLEGHGKLFSNLPSKTQT
jgi:hypothetical protein